MRLLSIHISLSAPSSLPRAHLPRDSPELRNIRRVTLIKHAFIRPVPEHVEQVHLSCTVVRNPSTWIPVMVQWNNRRLTDEED